MPSEDDDEDGEPQEMSKRKQKKANRLSVAELKRLVKKPEVVDWVDVSAQDPKLLIEIKSHRNTIPIPQHWSQKRDYLQGKRGIEKPQFQLPGFIADTGIATQRDAVKEKEEGQSLKQKTRERVQPKMGKIDIDYQKLHDAFFKFQTKPKMSEFGELYVRAWRERPGWSCLGPLTLVRRPPHTFLTQLLRGQRVRDQVEGEATGRPLGRVEGSAVDPAARTAALADQHAAVRPAAELPQLAHPGTERADSRRVSCRPIPQTRACYT